MIILVLFTTDESKQFELSTFNSLDQSYLIFFRI